VAEATREEERRTQAEVGFTVVLQFSKIRSGARNALKYIDSFIGSCLKVALIVRRPKERFKSTRRKGAAALTVDVKICSIHNRLPRVSQYACKAATWSARTDSTDSSLL